MNIDINIDIRWLSGVLPKEKLLEYAGVYIDALSAVQANLNQDPISKGNIRFSLDILDKLSLKDRKRISPPLTNDAISIENVLDMIRKAKQLMRGIGYDLGTKITDAILTCDNLIKDSINQLKIIINL